MLSDAAMEKQDYLKDEIREVISSFDLSGYDCVRRYGNGHINDTYLLEREESGHETYEEFPSYVLQRINRCVFVHPEEVAENVWKIIVDSREVYYQKCDEGWRCLGTDEAGMLDENDRPLVSTDGYWIHVGNQLISYETKDAVSTDEGVVYKGTTRALLNDSREIILDIEWEPVNDDTADEVTGKIIGYEFADNESFFMEKGKYELKPGDTIRFIFDYYNEEGKLIKSEPYGKSIVVTSMSALKVNDRYLGECDLKYGIILIDAYQRSFATEMLESHIPAN